ncbi:MAG: hypothetical protein AAB225_02425 [Acidobacteriota bacterium]
MLGNLSAVIKNEFAAVTLSSLDGSPLSRASRMLLTAAARVANTGMKCNEKRTSLVDWGAAPTLIEPVAGTVTLRNLRGASGVEAVALDGAARPLGQPIAARRTPAGWEIPIGEPAAPWHAVRVRR